MFLFRKFTSRDYYMSLAYRNDIDGLRALSVFLVIGFHYFAATLPGGFIGVDVFFVISGFFITRIIVKDLNNSSFSLAQFYDRRIRRIFPALLSMLIVVLVYGWLILLAKEFQILGEHSFFSAIFLVNFKFAGEAGYFDQASELKPLLHLWSLAVEEQFYIIWPLVLLLFHRVKPKARNRIIWLIAIISLGYCLRKGFLLKEKHFFSPLARTWQLISGGLVALHYSSTSKNWLTNQPWVKDCAIIMLVASSFIPYMRQYFPNMFALIPVCAAVVILYIERSSYLFNILFENPLIRYFGKISYPLYLWHWPLISYATIINHGKVPVFDKLILIILSLGLAYVTYEVVERNIRFRKERVSLGLVFAMLVIGVISFSIKTKIFVSATGSDAKITKVSEAIGVFEYPGPQMRMGAYDNYPCYFNKAAPPEIVFLGDSNIEQYAVRAAMVATEKNIAIAYMTAGGCPPIPNLYRKSSHYCQALSQRMRQACLAPSVKTVVLGAAWNGYLSIGKGEYFLNVGGQSILLSSEDGHEVALSLLQEFIDELIQKGRHVYIILPIPSGGEFAPENLLKRMYFSRPILTARTWAKPLATESKAVKLLKRLGQKTGAIIIDPHDYLCVSGKCRVRDVNGNPLYKDGGHLRPSWVRDNLSIIDAVFDN